MVLKTGFGIGNHPHPLQFTWRFRGFRAEVRVAAHALISLPEVVVDCVAGIRTCALQVRILRCEDWF